MTAEPQASLAEQRQSIRDQLQMQRQVLARQLAPPVDIQGRYPRSMTMRLLIQRPELVARLAAVLAGARFAGEVSAILLMIGKLRYAVAARERKSLPAPPEAKQDQGPVDMDRAATPHYQGSM